MKNKIIAIMLLVVFIVPMITFVNAAEETLTKEEIFNLACEELNADGHNYCIGMDINSDGNYIIYAFDYEPYILQVDGSNYLCIKESDDGKCYRYYVYYTAEGINLHSRIFSGIGGVKSTDLGDGYHQQTIIFETSYPNAILTNFDLKDSNENIFMGNSQDDTIGDPNSDLLLSYEYNEDFTECHINATLKNGAFTDKIYYSEYPFGVDGTLKTKKGFPVERYNDFWK